MNDKKALCNWVTCDQQAGRTGLCAEHAALVMMSAATGEPVAPKTFEGTAKTVLLALGLSVAGSALCEAVMELFRHVKLLMPTPLQKAAYRFRRDPSEPNYWAIVNLVADLSEKSQAEVSRSLGRAIQTIQLARGGKP